MSGANVMAVHRSIDIFRFLKVNNMFYLKMNKNRIIIKILYALCYTFVTTLVVRIYIIWVMTIRPNNTVKIFTYLHLL